MKVLLLLSRESLCLPMGSLVCFDLRKADAWGKSILSHL